MFFDARVHIGEGADRAGDGAGGDLLTRPHQPLPRPGEGGVMAGELQPEGGRFRMDAVAAADAGSQLVFQRTALQHRQQPVQVLQQEARRLGELHGEAGIQHVRRCHALMQEARRLAHMLGDIGQEGDDVMLGLALDLVDAGDIPAGALADLGRRRLRHDAEFGHGVGSVGLDLEPDAVAILRLPDLGHFRAAVTGDHAVCFHGSFNATDPTRPAVSTVG